MGDFFGLLAGGFTAVEQQKEIRSIAESLALIAAKLEASFSSGEPDEAKGASTKPENEGASTTRGRKEKGAKAVPEPTTKPKAPRSAKGVRKKGRGKKN
jgi:hypothetical protein